VGVLPMTLALRHAVKFFPSCRGSFVRAKIRSMGIGMKRFFVSAAICLIALQTILLGIAPLASLGSSVVDPFLIICRSEGQPHASDSSNGGSGSHRSSEDCLHCVLCTTSTPPLVPSAAIGIVALASFVLFIRPSLTAPYVGRFSGRTFARGPPQFAMTS
jgi:hypothetical protein